MRISLLATGCVVVGLLGCARERERKAPLAEAARACAAHAELSCPRPILSVRNLRASQRYFRDALGFKLDWEYGEPPDFASVSRADSVLFLCQGCQGAPGSWTMIFARDVDRLHAELVGRHAVIKMPPTNMPWRMREMQVADPDGNVLRFGTGLED